MVPMGLFVAKVCTVLHVGQVPGALERPMRFNQDNGSNWFANLSLPHALNLCVTEWDRDVNGAATPSSLANRMGSRWNCYSKYAQAERLALSLWTPYYPCA
ncbi:hypothetical protein N7489_008374 [Penicillium chrysogenum]|uniref:uncharacterized protein n=1 Tax=Penicillium chrysogenum TaxID=5076 RepID=UPI0024DF2175|nr:uncharacterized protein N7489_008374 [Penicillium chrysogenum]KAJ5227666.1 hypothetical protein N7489_008374 [Penicillium chrysogenum]KAJ6167165.1 hypothetical protein N7497_000008 [Penicillium chrysogenum]